jgi:hypothetical protein
VVAEAVPHLSVAVAVMVPPQLVLAAAVATPAAWMSAVGTAARAASVRTRADLQAAPLERVVAAQEPDPEAPVRPDTMAGLSYSGTRLQMHRMRLLVAVADRPVARPRQATTVQPRLAALRWPAVALVAGRYPGHGSTDHLSPVLGAVAADSTTWVLQPRVRQASSSSHTLHRMQVAAS